MRHAHASLTPGGLATLQRRRDARQADGDPSRSDQLRQFLASGANVALSHQDLANTPPKGPHHFLPIVRGDDGVWRNMDHTSSSFARRGGITDWGRVFQIEVDEDLYRMARSAAH